MLLTFGCGPGDPAILSFTADPTSGPPGTVVQVAIEVENFDLTGEVDHHTERLSARADTAEVSIDHEGEDHEPIEDGDDNLGHVHVYWDSFESNPLTQLEHPTGEFEIPADAAPGTHVLMARLHAADHLIIEPQVVAELDFVVTE